MSVSAIFMAVIGAIGMPVGLVAMLIGFPKMRRREDKPRDVKIFLGGLVALAIGLLCVVQLHAIGGPVASVMWIVGVVVIGLGMLGLMFLTQGGAASATENTFAVIVGLVLSGAGILLLSNPW